MQSDFEFTKVAVGRGFTAEAANTLLDGYSGRWADNSKTTLLDNEYLQDSLSAARNFVIQEHMVLCSVFQENLTPILGLKMV